MGNNSIKSNLSKDDIISDIILSIGADHEKNNIYIIVEGEDDISLINPYITDNVLIYESYDGKNGVEVIVGEKFADNKRVIGIRDKDYQSEPVSDKIFYYDFSCMEMMLVSNNDIFANLCFEYYRGGVDRYQLRTEILKELEFLSVIRMYNEKEQWGIVLRGISLNQALDSECLRINNGIIIDKINSMNNNFLEGEVLRRVNEEYERVWSDEYYYYCTQGHDFFHLFAAECNRYKRKKIKFTEIEASARCSFRWNDFIQTKLYAVIKEYTNQHGLQVFHADE